MITCKKAAALIDKKAEVKLSFMDNLKLSIHTALCKTCKLYEKMTLRFDASMSLFYKKNEDVKITLSDEKKEKIINSLKK
ncbi:hypothetical protein [Flammeovirga agarivorans]|uniref:Zinc-finger domain-containing protein n=1 Tax=Flammeovirga agarivorans TaxID=2726742 RepID=A0A7X8XWC0_9BACT|nr:hypothetical protein [Flammeovirga agarivorans]NLR92177.1 hypothetical protein [Flammeovirga agarivorans]